MHYKFWEEEQPAPQQTFSSAFDSYMNRQEQPAAQTRPPRFGNLAGLLLAVGLVVYGVAEWDIPVLYLSAAVLVFGLKGAAAKLPAPYGTALPNAMQGFAVALGLGALFLLW